MQWWRNLYLLGMRNLGHRCERKRKNNSEERNGNQRTLADESHGPPPASYAYFGTVWDSPAKIFAFRPSLYESGESSSEEPRQ